MLTVETTRKIRLAIHRDGKSIRQTAKELRVSRNTVRKAVRSQQTAFTYRRSFQPRPALGHLWNTWRRVWQRIRSFPSANVGPP